MATRKADRKSKKGTRKQCGGKRAPTETLIIHISGASGSGKTTLGNKLKEHFKSKIVVKDIDYIRMEFIKEHYRDKKWDVIDKDAYQQYIDDYIDKQDKPLIFVGLNNMPWWHKDLYYDMHPTHKFYINIPNEIVIKQKCIRFITDDLPSHLDNQVINDIMNNNEFFIKQITNLIKRECSMKEMVKLNNKWKKDYEKQGYKFMSRENIYKSVVKILNNNL